MEECITFLANYMMHNKIFKETAIEPFVLLCKLQES
nr:MAG TPA: hypothetical protein [Caudoviricetes sp.]